MDENLKKTALLIVLSLTAGLLSIHLPWIYDQTIGTSSASEAVIVERIDYLYWSFMAQKTTYNYAPTIDDRWVAREYLLVDQFWRNPPNIGSLIFYQIGMNRPLGNLWQGYYIIFLFQILTALFLFLSLFMNIATERWNPSLKQTALYVTTFLISLGAPIVGVNQYVRDWGFSGGRDFVQFQIGFYLATVSSILIIAYALSYIVRMLRE